MVSNLHDDFCAKTRFINAQCTCGGDEGLSYKQIVYETNKATEDAMRKLNDKRKKHG